MHSRTIGKILNFLRVTLREIEEEKSRWPEWKIKIKSRRTLLALTIIIKRGWQCKAGRKQLTPYQSEEPNHKTPTRRMKEEKGKTAGDKK